MAQRIISLAGIGSGVIHLWHSGIRVHVDIVQIRHSGHRVRDGIRGRLLRSIVTGTEIDHSAEEASDLCENIAEKAPLLLFEAGFLLFGLPLFVFLHDLNAGRFGIGAFGIDIMECLREPFLGLGLSVWGGQLFFFEDR